MVFSYVLSGFLSVFVQQNFSGEKMKKLLCAALIAGVFSGKQALADDFGPTQLNFSGFGTLGATHSDTREADVKESIVFPSGAGASKATSAGIDTRLGLQASAKINKQMSGIVQVVVDRRWDNTYTPQIEWANLKYEINQDSYVRAGRVVAPVFMYSESRNVGYALTQTRTPYEVYSLNPVTHLDGVDVGGRLELGGGTLSSQVTGGRAKLRLSVPVEVSGSAVMFNTTYEIEHSTFRFGYSKYRLDFMGVDKIGTYFDLYQQAVTGAGNLIQYPPETANAKFSNVPGRIMGVGYAYDNGSWLAQGEFVSRRAPGVVVQDANAWYAMGGFRVGKFTPYIGYSVIKSKEPPPHPPAVGAGGMSNMAAFLINMIDADYNEHNEQSRISLGTRYDFYRNLALKVQFDHIRKPASPAVNNGLFSGTSLGFAAGSQSVNLLTVNLDFVF